MWQQPEEYHGWKFDRFDILQFIAIQQIDHTHFQVGESIVETTENWKTFKDNVYNGKIKQLSFGSFYGCQKPKKYILIIAEMILVFKYNLEELPSLKNLDQNEQKQVFSLSSESLSANTPSQILKKKFYKITSPAFSLLPATSHMMKPKNIILVIETNPADDKYLQVKVLTYQLFLYRIDSNLTIENLQKYTRNMLGKKMETIQNVCCFIDHGNKNIRGEILDIFLQEFKKITFYFQEGANNHRSQHKLQGVIKTKNHTNLYTNICQSRLVLSSELIPESEIQYIEYIFGIYQLIDKVIKSRPLNPDFIQLTYFKNQTCLNFYGVLFNYIRKQRLFKTTIKEIHNKLIANLINQKGSKEGALKNVKNRHFMTECNKKDSKKCNVCSSKTNFMCQQCSNIYDIPFHLCHSSSCFKEFHQNTQSYIPQKTEDGAEISLLYAIEKAQQDSRKDLQKIKAKEIIKDIHTTLRETNIEQLISQIFHSPLITHEMIDEPHQFGSEQQSSENQKRKPEKSQSFQLFEDDHILEEGNNRENRNLAENNESK